MGLRYVVGSIAVMNYGYRKYLDGADSVGDPINLSVEVGGLHFFPRPVARTFNGGRLYSWES